MKTIIPIQNLKCGGCVKTITSKLMEINTISDVIVDVETSNVSFEHKTKEEALAVTNRLKSLGYPTTENKNSIASKAMSFVSCATGKLSKA
jgi:copper chaperone CopZ